MIKIAVDAMGSDNAPRSEVEGAIAAARTHGVQVILVGKEEVLRPMLGARGADGLGIEVRHAAQAIAMDESPASALRRKRDSSIHLAAELVKEGKAGGLVSAGNTGAVMAVSKMLVGVVPGVDRPALATVVPTLAGHAVLLDVGANISCKPHHLVQFALMGHLFSRHIVGTASPRLGLMSVGEEESKGTDLTKEVHKALKALDLNFIGNVEGRDIYSGRADVIVCDGFTGNVALKTSEGLVEAMLTLLREELSKDLPARLGALLTRHAYRRLKKRLDYSEYGGAPLLGVKGVVIICHGRSNDNAIRNAIRVATESAAERVNARIESEIARWQAENGQLAAG